MFTLLLGSWDSPERAWVLEKTSVTLGSSARCDVVLPEAAPALCAQIKQRSGRYILKGLDEKTPVLMDARPLNGHGRLRHGAKLMLGSAQVSFWLGDHSHRVQAPAVSACLTSLRELLYDTPGKESWDKICALFERWPPGDDLTLGVEYARQHLESWPDGLRRAPERWKERFLQGRHDARLSLIRTLDLNYHYLDLEDIARLTRTPQIRGLTGLWLRTAFVRDEGVAHLAQARTLPDLKTLDLAQNGVTDEGCQALGRSHTLQGLRWLSMASNPIGAKGVRALAESASLAHLNHLDLSHTQGFGGTLRALVRSRVWESLTTLTLRAAGLDADCMETLVRAPGGCLAELHLEDNRLGDQGVLWLTRWPGLRKVHTLRLGNNQLTNRSALALARSPLVAGLRELSLARNDLDEHGLEALASSPHLKRLVTLDTSHTR